MIYGVMVRDAEGEGTEFFVCVAKNFEEAQEFCEEQFVKGTDFTIVDAEWMLNYQYDGFATWDLVGACYAALHHTLRWISRNHP